jgi:WhiB family redox-sensing transcriptional regulator
MTSTTLTTTLAGTRPDVLPCHADPDLWFAKDNDDTMRAKSACLPCPIRSACLSAAVDRGEPWGVWGGELLSSGQVIPRQPRRGRPPKVRIEPPA